MNDTPNSDEAAYWAGPSGATWITHETRMDEILSSVVTELLGRAGDVVGSEVLDIGCGTGAVSIAFSEAGARVTANDIAPPFLQRVAERGKGRIDTLLADAQSADWPRTFDLAVSRFGVMFFADPGAAFANIARALKPDGRLLFAAWGPFEDNPWWFVPQSVAARRMGMEPTVPNPHAPGPMGLSDRDWSLDKMRNGGLTDVDCEIVDTALRQSGDAQAVGELSTQIGPAARVLRLAEASDDDRAFVADQIAGAFKTYEIEGAVHIPARLHLFSARRR